MFRSLRPAVGFAATRLALASAAPAHADDEDARSYVARYELETAAGIVRASETLGVRREHATSFVSVASQNGALVSLPTEFAADGEIIANSFDPSVTCYNMAAAALYSSDSAPSQPAAVYVRLGDATIAVPVTFAQTQRSGDERTLAGSGARSLEFASTSERVTAAISIDARIAVRAGALSDVTFDEVTFVGTPAKAVSRMTCSLARTRRALPPQAAPGAVSS